MLEEDQSTNELHKVPGAELGNAPITTDSQEPQLEDGTDSEMALKEDKEERNYRALRQKAESVAIERDELARQLQEYRSVDNSKAEPSVPDEIEEVLGSSDIVEGRHLSKMGRKIKNLESQIKNYEQKRDHIDVESRLKSQYSDFASVVSKENVEVLKSQYPEIASTLSSSSDLYSAGVTAYTFIKKFGIIDQNPSKDDRFVDQRKKRINDNLNKPRSLSSISPHQGDSPLSNANAFANGLTDELKKNLLKEMEECRRSF